MGIIATIIVIIMIIGLFADKIGSKKQDSHRENVESRYPPKDEEDNTQENMNTEENDNPDTAGLMYGALNALGCQPKMNDDDTMSVDYQGESFRIEFGGRYARVWDPAWDAVKADDPEMPEIREAVNSVNYLFGPTVVLSPEKDEGVIYIHSHYDLMLHPACPDNALYIKAVLDSFFDSKEGLRKRYQQFTAPKKKVKKNRRPVGFTTNFDTENNNTEKPE